MAQLGTIKVQTDSGIVDVPVFDTGDSGSSVSEALRVQTDSGEGFVPLVAPADASSPQKAIRVQTDSGIKAVTDSATLSQIPDSAIAHYDAISAFGPGDDNRTISTWQDELGRFDLTGGSPVVRDSEINGRRALDFSSDKLSSSTPQYDQPNTIFAVLEGQFTGTGNGVQVAFSSTSSGSRNSIKFRQIGQGWEMFAGSGSTRGTNDPSIQLLTYVYDGANSLIRENGVETASGNPGSQSLENFSVGEDPFNNSWTGYIGEILPCDARLSTSEIESQEQRLADKWGITI